MKKLALLVVILSFAACAQKPVIKAKILSYAGTVSVNGEVISAPERVIKTGDVIEAGKGSFCEILINEKNLLRISNDAKLVYNISETSETLELQRGWIGGLTKQKFTKNGSYLIKTSTVTAAIRGTAFCAVALSPEETYFCVCNGRIDLAKEGDERSDSVEAAHHSARRYTKSADGAIAVDENPGMLFHNDAGIEAMGKTIGVSIDWTKPDKD